MAYEVEYAGDGFQVVDVDTGNLSRDRFGEVFFTRHADRAQEAADYLNLDYSRNAAGWLRGVFGVR